LNKCTYFPDYFIKTKNTANIRQAKAAKWFHCSISPLKSTDVKTTNNTSVIEPILPVTTMQGFYEIELTIGVKEYIAVRKTKRSPLVVKVPNGLHLNDDLTLTYTEYDRSRSRWIYDISAVTTKTMKIQEYFKKYSDIDRLNVDLSYRDRIIQNESTALGR